MAFNVKTLKQRYKIISQQQLCYIQNEPFEPEKKIVQIGKSMLIRMRK